MKATPCSCDWLKVSRPRPVSWMLAVDPPFLTEPTLLLLPNMHTVVLNY